MALARCNFVIQDGSGNIVNGATVTVRVEATGLLLNVPYSDRDGSVSLGNPYVAADGADAGFYAVAGSYEITVAHASFGSRTWNHEAVGLLQEDDSVSADEVSYVHADSPADINTVQEALDRIFDEGVGGGAASAAFSAIKSGTQGIADATHTKVTFVTEIYDVGSYYDAANSRWVPPAGKVTLIVGLHTTGTNIAGSYHIVSIYKNGSAFKKGIWYTTSSPAEASGVVVIDDNANGTDYYEAYCYFDTSASTPTVDSAADVCYFMGHAWT